LAALIMYIPRHPISVEFLKILLTWARAMGAPDVPLFDAYQMFMKIVNEEIGGSHILPFMGSQENIFWAKSIGEAIRQMRAYLSFKWLDSKT
jgi:hypothetical protein